MKNLILLLSLFFSFMTFTAFAETVDEAQLGRETAQKQKMLIVLENLNLTAEEQQAFLPVYREYQDARRYNNEALGRLIVDFAKNYETMTDDKALSLLNEVLAVKQGRLDIKKGYIDKFKTVLPGTQIARYYQIESKLEAIAEVKLAEVIPLVQ